MGITKNCIANRTKGFTGSTGSGDSSPPRGTTPGNRGSCGEWEFTPNDSSSDRNRGRMLVGRLRIVLHLLREHCGQVCHRIRHIDGIFIAYDLTQATTHAGFLIHYGDLIMEIRRPWVRPERNTIERTNIDAILTRRAIVSYDLCFRNFFYRHSLDQLPIRVLNARYRTIDRTNSTFDASARVNLKNDFLTASDRVGRTFLFANSTTDARVCDEICHDKVESRK